MGPPGFPLYKPKGRNNEKTAHEEPASANGNRTLQRMGRKESVFKNPNFQMACVIFLLGTILLVTLIGDVILL
jgi:hypothetical protein